MRKIKIIPVALLILLLCACARQTQDVVLFDPMSTSESSAQTQPTATSDVTQATTQRATETTEPSTVETTEPTTAPTQAPTKPTQPTEAPKPVKKDHNSTPANTVWIPTKGGKKYHDKPTCSNMSNPDEVTKAEAERRGFTPCKKCYK